MKVIYRVEKTISVDTNDPHEAAAMVRLMEPCEIALILSDDETQSWGVLDFCEDCDGPILIDDNGNAEPHMSDDSVYWHRRCAGDE